MSMINTALSGLMAAQRGLEATSNNVANAGTDGYVRRRTIQAEAITAGAGVLGGLGSGVNVTGVERLYDQFLTDALRGTTTTEQRAQVMADLTARLDSLLGNPELGIGTSIQSFFDKAELLGRDPTSATNRQQLLLQGESLSQRFRELNTQIGALGDEVDRRIEDSVSRINALATSLAKINESLGRGAGSANDLLDQRDALLGQLAGQVDTTVIRQDDGTVSVLVGGGQPLVLGTTAARLSVDQDTFDPSRMQVSIELGGQSLPISRLVAGGALGGLLGFRSEALDPASRDLGLLAATLANAFNAQHAEGADANGNLGGDFFRALTSVVLPASTNAGTGTVAATITDATALVARDYELRFDGTAWTARDASTGQPVAMTGAGTAASPFQFEGLSVTVSGSASASDRFLVRPFAGAAGRFGVAISDASRIAAAAPVRTARSLANVSDASIALAGIADATNSSLQQPVRILFSSATSFNVVDALGNDLSGPLAYTSDADITFNGWTVRISGTPAAGDSFTVGPAPPGSADNTNALALARLPGQGVLENGRVSVDDLVARIVSTVGSNALRSSQDLEVQGALREQTQTDLEGISGVNLDEEAANVLKYQQAYQAASKIIGVADEMFRSLLSMLR